MENLNLELEQIEFMLNIVKGQIVALDKELAKQLELNSFNVSIDSKNGKTSIKETEQMQFKVGYTELQNHSRELMKQYYSLLVLKLQINQKIKI